jgi:hypothetical protein
MGESRATMRQATRADAIGGRFDPWLLGVSLALACFGVVMVASSSIAIGEGLGVGPFYFLEKHVMFLAAGIALAAWAMRTELKTVEQHGQWLLLACFVLLLLVFVPGVGVSVNGARRWLNLGLANATEQMEDDVGDDDGLCEAGETCLYTPNFGAYQGHGTLTSCTYNVDGGLSGISMYYYPTNGY